jgi:hypothetical protein
VQGQNQVGNTYSKLFSHPFCWIKKSKEKEEEEEDDGETKKLRKRHFIG